MAPVLSLLIIIIAALLPGTFAVLCWGKRFEDDPVEFLFAGLSLGLLALGWLALILAEVGRFSLGLLGALWAVGLIALVCYYASLRSKQALGRRKVSINRWEVGALSVWIVLAAWLFFRPHEFILGGADAGVYVNLGANIARTGGILIHDSTLAALDPSLYPSLLRPLPPGEVTPYYLMPAFYVPGTPAGLIVPQFYPLHPVWQAVGYALGGLRAELLLTPLWGFLGALVLILLYTLIIRESFGVA